MTEEKSHDEGQVPSDKEDAKLRRPEDELKDLDPPEDESERLKGGYSKYKLD